jgi:DNA invertase Pin-like site-specific DNA recombinase
VKVYDALIRVGKTNGRKESDDSTMTIRDQETAIKRAITDAGGRLGRTFKALDQSGFTIHESDVYPALLERVRSGKSAGFVVGYGDRLSRNWRTVGKFFDDLEAIGAEYIDASSPEIDYRTDEGRMLTGMKAVMGEVPSLTARKRGKRIADETVARGVPNAVPYGYRRNVGPDGVKTDLERDAKALIPDEVTAPIVRRIFALRLDGYKWSAIVRTLNEAGVPSPRGGLWTHNTVSMIVQNPVYTGVVLLGQRRKEGAHAALVSRADWKRAQSTRTVVRSGRYAGGLAGGLVVCAGCGRPLKVAGTDARLVYGCRRSSTAGVCSRPVYVTKDAADEFVAVTIEHVLSHGTLGAITSSRELEQQHARVDAAKAELEAYVVNAAALDAVLFKAGLDARQAKHHEEQALYDELVARAAEVTSLPDGNGWRELAGDLEAQRRVARSLVENIVVGPPVSRSPRAPIEERFTIVWRGGGQDAGTGR